MGKRQAGIHTGGGSKKRRGSSASGLAGMMQRRKAAKTAKPAPKLEKSLREFSEEREDITVGRKDRLA